MKRLTTLITLMLFLYTLILAQNECSIERYVQDFIKLEKVSYNHQDFVVKRVTETENTSCVSSLVNNNPMLISYLLTNYSSSNLDQKLLASVDSSGFSRSSYGLIARDSLFQPLLTELAEKTVLGNRVKDTISLNQLINIAVKYFSINKITAKGYYSGKVCAGLNDIKATEKNRQPYVEAFCFSSILKHYKGKRFSMYDEFVIALKQLYEVNLGIEKDERLLRAQGAMYVLMKNNEQLSRMLIEEYKLQEPFLPFVVALN